MKKLIAKVVALGLVAIAVVFAAEVYATTGPLQGVITYYNKNDGSDFYRSTTPYVSGIETQSDNPDGSVTVKIDNAAGYVDSGFSIYFGKLADLKPLTLSGVGDDYGLNLWFDTSNNGEFFAWDSSGKLTSLDGDTYGLGPTSSGGNLTVDGSSLFWMMTAPYGSYSLEDLKSGSFPRITGDTYVAIWVGIDAFSESQSATLTSLSWFPLLSKEQCMKDGWRTFTAPTFKNQGECVSSVQHNADH